MQGSSDLAKAAATEGDFEKLRKMQEHGADILGFRDSANQESTLLHFSVKTGNLQLLKFLKSVEAVNFNV